MNELNLYEKINKYFRRSKLSKKEFGNRVGVSEVTIHKILNGEQSVKVDTLQKIAQVLETDITAFFISENEINAIEYLKSKGVHSLVTKIPYNQAIEWMEGYANERIKHCRPPYYR